MAAPLVATVVAAHRAPGHPPIRIETGQALMLGRADTDWPQFTWVVRDDGLGGWVPTSLLQRVAGDPARAVARDAYDTTELAADAGARVRLHRLLADWWWAEDDHGTRGWIPARVLASPAPAGTTD
ncbi:SH3 domain-containing protein [Luteimonas sp. FCS-9]|uniref:SH3 domain-containing protein n=1 Tax=Luteimonas sp. FCS-9 TaxID=1547516 RepID=UPI00063EC358|nr:SH3 domain-containing protein [Luteimonas sp. FCS-9]KLI99462.1 hypothetical protein WQ56_12520 [Luteimonas sp. FCS-9]